MSEIKWVDWSVAKEGKNKGNRAQTRGMGELLGMDCPSSRPMQKKQSRKKLKKRIATNINAIEERLIQ